MTDPGVADVVYLEPLTVASVERILEREKPDGILSGLGGQTALNLCVAARARGACSIATRHAPAGHAARGDRDGRGPPGVPCAARSHRPALSALGHRRGRDAARAPGARRARRSTKSACPRSFGRPSPWAARAAASCATEAEYFERVRSGLRASPIGQVIVEKLPDRLAGGRVRGHARRGGYVHRRVLDGERRPAGRPHRRLDRRRTGPDAVRPDPPATAHARHSTSSARWVSRAAATSSSRCRPTTPSTP